MSLALVDGLHIRVLCDACHKASAEVCTRKDLPTMARVAAVRELKAAGWRHDPGRIARPKTLDDMERDGSGRWYCPECGR